MVDPGSSSHTRAGEAFARSSGWSDALGALVSADKKASLVYEEYRDTAKLCAFMSSSAPGAATELSQDYQFDHEWDPQGESEGAPNPSVVRYHWHWRPCADPLVAQQVKLSGYYVWTRVGEAVPALAGWTTFSKLFTVLPGDVYKPRIDSIVEIPVPSWAKESAILEMYLTRDFSDPQDTYTTTKSFGTGHANVLVQYLDIHVWKAKAGTKVEYPT